MMMLDRFHTHPWASAAAPWCLQDVLLVVYAPWCPYCRSLEPEVDHLATSLQGQGPVQVAVFRGDLQGHRAFAKEVLTVQTLPTVLLFPRNSNVFFKYRSPHRDATSLLRFINSLCQHGRPTWALEEPQVRCCPPWVLLPS